MTHIDEGTIHAWLDDALAPEEAASVEAHVHDCAECSAAVAEARGFIAASSRILSALDDVPEGVIQRVEGDATGVKPERVKPELVKPEVVKPSATPARRRWWQRPQFAAAAGIAFIAVTLSVVARRDGVKSVADYSLERAPASGAQRAEAPPAAAADKAPKAAVATPPKAAAATPPKAAAAPSPQAAVAGGTARPVDSTNAKRTLTLSPDAITRTEKARLAGDRNVQQEAVVAIAAEARSDTRRDATTVQGIVGCYRLQRRVPALDAGVTEIISLEEIETGRHEGEVLRSARLIGAQPQANTQWYWTLSPKGDVSLVRAQAGAYANFPLALRMAAQTGETSIATRIDCPTR